jgi:hypothetical protein
MMIATVELHTGRWCLMIAGLVIAVEGDPCREWSLARSRWVKLSLEQAATQINTAIERPVHVDRIDQTFNL